MSSANVWSYGTVLQSGHWPKSLDLCSTCLFFFLMDSITRIYLATAWTLNSFDHSTENVCTYFTIKWTLMTEIHKWFHMAFRWLHQSGRPVKICRQLLSKHTIDTSTSSTITTATPPPSPSSSFIHICISQIRTSSLILRLFYLYSYMSIEYVIYLLCCMCECEFECECECVRLIWYSNHKTRKKHWSTHTHKHTLTQNGIY